MLCKADLCARRLKIIVDDYGQHSLRRTHPRRSHPYLSCCGPRVENQTNPKSKASVF